MVFERVILYCSKNNLSIPAFERKCGLSNGLVMKWKDKNYNPSISTLQKMVLATGVCVEDWLREVDQSEFIEK